MLYWEIKPVFHMFDPIYIPARVKQIWIFTTMPFITLLSKYLSNDFNIFKNFCVVKIK
jgi:hypothetical protein